MSELPIPPVLFIIFKRPETTARVFASIRAARPPVLYVAADGPRENHPGEAEQCDAVRKIALTVDWPCKVETKFRDRNAGIKKNVSVAISWFLEANNEGIILEDDCCPGPDFFEFAAEMLQHYRDDPAVYHISGSCFQPRPRGDSSYFWSRYNHGWGWATWKRAWQHCDLEMRTLDQFLAQSDANQFWMSGKEKKYWTRIFRDQQAGKIDTWDYQWKFTLWRDQAMAIYPNNNMVSNLGFNELGTNTTSFDSGKAERGWETPMKSADGSWLNPVNKVRNFQADQWTFKHLYWGSGVERLRAKLRKLVNLLRGKL